MSRHATAYVNSLGITDATARTVLLLLAERTHAPGDPHGPEDVPDIMGLDALGPQAAAAEVGAGVLGVPGPVDLGLVEEALDAATGRRR